MNQQSPQKELPRKIQYQEVEEIDEDEDYFLNRRNMFRQAKKNIQWKGTFAQKIGNTDAEKQQSLQVTFYQRNQFTFINQVNQGSESEFSEFNSSFSSEEEKQQEKLSDSTNKTTGTFSMTVTENSDQVEKGHQSSTDHLGTFPLQQNNLELLKVEKYHRTKEESIQKQIVRKENNSPFKNQIEGLDKSVYLKPGKSKYQAKVQSLSDHTFLKYKQKSIEVSPNNINFIFQEFLKKDILLPQVKLEEVPKKYWKGIAQLLVLFINNKYSLVFRSILENFNKNKIYNKFMTQNNRFFELSILKSKYSKAQMLIEALQQKIQCLSLIKDQYIFDIEQQEKKIQNLWFMISFEKAQELCSQKIKANKNKITYKSLRTQMIKDRDWWISNYFHNVDI